MEEFASDRQKLEAAHRTNTFIWLALTFSVFLYNALVLGMDIRPETARSESSPMLEIILGGLGFVSLIFAVIIKPMMLSPNRKLPQRGEQLVLALINNYRNAVIVQWAMAETVALYGFVGAILVGNRPFLFIMSVVCLVGMIFFRPSLDGLSNYVETMKRKMRT